MRMAFGGEGPPTPVNGSVSRIEVDDTRDQTCRSNDVTEPLKESPCQKLAHEPHALSTKIHMSDLARSQSVVRNEVSGIVISPVQPDNSNRDEFGLPVGMPQAQDHLQGRMDNMSLDEAMDDARPEAKALPITEVTLNAGVSSNTDLSSVANGRAGSSASETGTQPPKQVESRPIRPGAQHP